MSNEFADDEHWTFSPGTLNHLVLDFDFCFLRPLLYGGALHTGEIDDDRVMASSVDRRNPRFTHWLLPNTCAAGAKTSRNHLLISNTSKRLITNQCFVRVDNGSLRRIATKRDRAA